IFPKAPEDDPLWKNGKEGSLVSLNFLEFETKRRYRTNGVICKSLNQKGMCVQLKECFSTCPKYIQARTIVAFHTLPQQISPPKISEEKLTEELTQFITAADTFYIATYCAETGADASHRGGRAGFVRVVDDKKLLWGDYFGKNMFQTLGNTLKDPHAGLLFIDYERGHTLQLTGTIKIEHVGTGNGLDGADRNIMFTISKWIYREYVSPYRWAFVDYSSHAPLLKDTDALKQTSKDGHVISQVEKWRKEGEARVVEAILTEIIVESPTVKTFRFTCKSPETPEPGQYATFTIDINSQSSIMRSWTLTSARYCIFPKEYENEETNINLNQSSHIDISVRRQASGIASNWLHDHAKVDHTFVKVMGIEGSFTLSSSLRLLYLHPQDKLKKNQEWKLFMLTGGIGITPILSMLRGLKNSIGNFKMKKKPEVVLLHSNKSASDFPFLNELKELENSGILKKLALSITNQNTQGDEFDVLGVKNVQYGRVDEKYLKSVVSDVQDRIVYLCGPPPFMEAMVKILRPLGVPECHIITESFDY
ncbi:MAG: pyridoxamine 5'-phosphate oxidase family protein, partial [Actinobacteria bacterium]|nr:pyridoxamine 5'-phosphate oxidase family protein [Actinomycetota bacterium]